LPDATIEVKGFEKTTNRHESSLEQARFENASVVALSAMAQRLQNYLKNRVA